MSESSLSGKQEGHPDRENLCGLELRQLLWSFSRKHPGQRVGDENG